MMQSVETISFPTTALLHEVTGGKDDGSPVTYKGTEGRYWYSCLSTPILGASLSAQRPGTFTPARDPVPTEQEVGVPQGRSGWVQKISTPPGFEPQTVQPVESHYTGYFIPGV